jgi:AAA+ ATPase superfamily predicted ATPase
MADWKFYGRKEQLTDLERMLERKRWFFAKVTGRRRIGKTALIQRATQEIGSTQPVLGVTTALGSSSNGAGAYFSIS